MPSGETLSTNIKLIEANLIIQTKNLAFGTFLSSNLAFIGSFVLIGLPIFMLFFLLKKSKNLRERSYKNKFGTLYAELNYNYIWKDKVVLLEPFFSLMRVLLLTLSLLLLKDFRYF